MTNRFAVWLGVAVAAACVPACGNPDGAAEFKASQRAVQHLDQLTIEWTTRSDLGVFTETTEIDCTQHYFHHRYVKDLSPRGIEEGVTQAQGRPRRHQEEEGMFVGGKSYSRDFGSWENPNGGDDSHSEWGGTSTSYDPREECDSMHQGKDNAFIPFSKILAQNHIEYRGRRAADSVQCHDYQVTYPDLVYTDNMKTTELGPGSSFSEREQVTKPVQSTICIGTKDLLPREVLKGDLSVKFSYRPIQLLPDPAGVQ